MGKRRIILLVIVLAVGIFVWQLPTLLKAIPSRYVAAYLPEPVQALAERDHAETLPSAVAVADAGALLQSATAPVEADEPAGTALPPPIVIRESSDTSKDPQPTKADPVTPPPLEPTAVLMPSQTPTATSVPIPSAARLDSFSHHFQGWNNCGPATLAMGLSHFNLFQTQEQTAAVLKPNPEDRNVSPHEMVAYVNDKTHLAAIDRTNGNLDTLRRLIANGFPVIIELGIDPPGDYRWMGWYGHYLLVVAYDDAQGQLWVYDSWFGTSEVPGENADPEGRRLSYADLNHYWRQFNRTYIVMFAPDKATDVATIIGPDMDDHTMWQRALSAAQEEASSDPDNAFVWFNLGTVYNAVGEFQKATTAYDQARAIGLPWRMLWYQFGPYEAYYRVGRYEDVLLLADATLMDRPYFEEAFYYKGIALLALGETKQAADSLERAVRFNPNFAPAVIALEQLST